MKPKLIVISHGKMAEETLQSAKMIVGDLLAADYISMTATDGMVAIREELNKLLNQYPQQPILVLADLRGGTPCNVAFTLLPEYPNLRVISGLNLAMVIEYTFSEEENIDALSEHLISIGKEAVGAIELVQ